MTMRTPRSALLPLALVACAFDNPAFGVGPITASDGVGSVSTGTTTGEPLTTSTGDEPVTTTGEPITTTGEPDTTSGSTTQPVEQCGFDAPIEPRMFGYDKSNDLPLTNCGASRMWVGPARMEGGAFGIEDAGTCDTMAENVTFVLGDKYPSDQLPRVFKCARAVVTWHPAEDCRIGTLQVFDLDGDPNTPALAYSAALGQPTQPAEFLLWPERRLVEQCGCDGAKTCCQPYEPGRYELAPFGGAAIEVGGTADYVAPFKPDGRKYRFHNIESQVEPTCREASDDEPARGQHFSWFLEQVVLP